MRGLGESPGDMKCMGRLLLCMRGRMRGIWWLSCWEVERVRVCVVWRSVSVRVCLVLCRVVSVYMVVFVRGWYRMGM